MVLSSCYLNYLLKFRLQKKNLFHIYGCYKSESSYGVYEYASMKLCILGLDPAQPCFQADDPDIRLDPSDAEFIDVIHTNGRTLLKAGLGMPQPIGDCSLQLFGI
jgi:hypothetical protein